MVALAGCGGGTGVNPELTKEAAKAIAQEGELRIVGFIPEEFVAAVDQHEKGTLLSCQGDRNYAWSGGTDVSLHGGDADKFIDDIVAMGGKDGWRAQRETAASGGPRAVLFGPDGDSYVVDALPDRPIIGMTSSSPCFQLPDGEYPESF